MGKTKTATVFGGTGFIGRQVVRELAARDVVVKVATRVPERAYFLRPCGAVGQVIPYACDYNDADSLREAVRGSDCVVNCIGILFERKKSKFERIHLDLAERIAKACKKENVGRFVHISALGVDKASSKYAYSKKEGEDAVMDACGHVSILRPSVVFGPDDEFFNMFAQVAQIVPFAPLPLVGGGHTRFQPVYVGDVADAVMACLQKPEADVCGKVFELGGPEIVTLRGVMEKLFEHSGLKRGLVALPWALAKIKAGFLSLLPRPLLTPDQVDTLKTDNVVSNDALTFKDLDIMPTAMDSILPQYLKQYRPGGSFGKVKRA